MPESNPFRRRLTAEGKAKKPLADEISIPVKNNEFVLGSTPVDVFDPAPVTSPSPPRQLPPSVSPRLSKRPIPPPPPSARGSHRRSQVFDVPPPPPPPAIQPPTLSISTSVVDPFEADEDDGEDANPQPIPPPKSPSYKPVPLNPFRKPDTVSDVRNNRMSFDIHSLRFGVRDGNREIDRPSKASVRQSLDVDTFKRLILTGNIGAVGGGNGSTQLPLAPNTIRPSIKEIEVPPEIHSSETTPTKEPKAITPVMEVSLPSISSPRSHSTSPISDAGSDTSKPVNTVAGPRLKPPPPKPRGRPVAASNDQSLKLMASSNPALPRPVSPITPVAPSGVGSERLDQPSSNTVISSKPLPPSPPLARRDSTRRKVLPTSTTAGISRSNSVSRPAPPPPPSRRATHSSHLSRPSSVVIPNGLQIPGLEGSAATSKGITPPPPPPRGARRRPASGYSTDQEGVPPPPSSTHSSTGFQDSEKGLERSSNSNSNSGSSSSSVQPPKFAEVSQVQMEDTLGEGDNVDILANLEILQREVDALKGLVEKRSSSAV